MKTHLHYYKHSIVMLHIIILYVYKLCVCIYIIVYYVLLLLHVVYSDDEWMLTRIWNSEQNWFKTEEVIIREKEEKWIIDMREKDMKLTLLQSSESSLKYTVDMLNKREIIKSLNNNLSCDDFVLELQESQKLLEIQKTISLAKSQELEDSKKPNILLKKTLTHTSTISSGLY